MDLLTLSKKNISARRKANGFTLLEMLIVVSIILILATIAVPKLTSSAKTAKVAKIQADMRTVSNAAALYEAENGKMPTDIKVLVTETNGKKYLQVEPKVPDGSDYTLDTDGIVSCTFDTQTYKSTDQPAVATKG